MEPEQTVETVETEAPEAAASIADHAAQFSPGARAEADPEPAPQPELKPIRPVDQQRRADQGRFAEGKKPVRAKDAVSRINELTGRAKTAEEKLVAAEAELTRLRSERAAPAQITRAEQRVETAEAKVETTDTEPSEDDPAYGGDYGKFLEARARWSARDEYRKARQTEHQQMQQARQHQAHQQFMGTWVERMKSAESRYADWQQVASTPAPWLRNGKAIPEAEMIDAFIMEDENGPDVLYHLLTNLPEAESLLRIEPRLQYKRLSLISQRFDSDEDRSSGGTGSLATPRLVNRPPTPPNPVRTEAQRVSTGPPTDRPLSIAEHQKYYGPKARAR